MGLMTEAAAPYILAGVGALALIAGGTIAWQHHHIKALEKENGLYAIAAKGYADAQTTNLATIADLQTAARALIAQRAVDQAAATKAANDAASKAAVRDHQLASLTQELHDVYAKSASARAWGAAGVDAGVLARLPQPAAAHGH